MVRIEKKPKQRTRSQYIKNAMSRDEPIPRIINPAKINVIMKSLSQITSDLDEVLEYIETKAKPAYHQDSVEHKFVLRLKYAIEGCVDKLHLFAVTENIALAGRNHDKPKEVPLDIPKFLEIAKKNRNENI